MIQGLQTHTLTEQVQGLAITSETGKVYASPKLRVEENLQTRAQYALLSVESSVFTRLHARRAAA